MSERIILVVFVIGLVVAGIMAGGAGLVMGVTPQDRWTPRDYVAEPGDCFVPPQGDPLYDAHYAEKVNQPNCDAFKDQAEAKNVDAQTRFVDAQTQDRQWETRRQNIFTVILGMVLVGVIGFFVYAISH